MSAAAARDRDRPGGDQTRLETKQSSIAGRAGSSGAKSPSGRWAILPYINFPSAVRLHWRRPAQRSGNDRRRQPNRVSLSLISHRHSRQSLLHSFSSARGPASAAAVKFKLVTWRGHGAEINVENGCLSKVSQSGCSRTETVRGRRRERMRRAPSWRPGGPRPDREDRSNWVARARGVCGRRYSPAARSLWAPSESHCGGSPPSSSCGGRAGSVGRVVSR